MSPGSPEPALSPGSPEPALSPGSPEPALSPGGPRIAAANTATLKSASFVPHGDVEEACFLPRRGTIHQPRATPWVADASWAKPCKGVIESLSPLQGFPPLTHILPGLRPGLMDSSPSGSRSCSLNNSMWNGSLMYVSATESAWAVHPRPIRSSCMSVKMGMRLYLPPSSWS